MSSTYTSQPTSTKAPGPKPAPNALPAITLPADGDPDAAATFQQALEEPIDWCGYLNQQPKLIPSDGIDGNVTLDGTVAAPSGMTKVGTVYTMTRDFFFGNITVTGAGVVLKTANWRLFFTGTLTTAAGGKITNDGVDASAGTGGVATAVGSLGKGSDGGAGGTSGGGGGGGAGSNITVSLGGTGGNGGGGGGAGAFGAAGTVTAPSASAGSVHVFNAQTIGWLFSNSATWAQLNGGSGGGGGGSSGAGVGGGGGSGGGVMVIIGRTMNLANANDIHCSGGKGGDGGLAAIDSGGGGGGGGLLIVGYGYCNQTLSAAINCPGGAAGASNAGAGAASAGSNGTLIQFAFA